MELTEKPQSGHEYAETLLAAANKEQRGKLTVFLGAAAGVGKTCSMLQEAHARLREGTDVVLGLVLTHGRKETAALLEGLPRIPEQEIEYHGKMLQEMDLDAILRRRPQLVVVDELAHSNVPGFAPSAAVSGCRRTFGCRYRRLYCCQYPAYRKPE